MSAAFLILAIVTILAACAAMTLRGLVHCALALAVAFAGIGTLYLSLGAQFLGLAQLLVYVGAIAVLIVFVILLTRGGESDAQPDTIKRHATYSRTICCRGTPNLRRAQTRQFIASSNR